MSISRQRRQDIIDALRRGTVPQYGLDALAVGLGHLEQAFDDELAKVARGGAVFKAIRGEYGSGKTFVSRNRPFRRVISRSGLTPYADPVIHRRRISAHAEATPLTLSRRAMAGLD